MLGTASFGDLPMKLAHARLNAQGYQVEETPYVASDLIVQAVAGGSADFGNGAITAAWTAVARGARIRTVMEHVANPHRFVVAQGVSACAELEGRRLALHGEGGVVNTLVRAFLAEECPDVTLSPVYMEDSSSRAAALLTGQLDAAPIDLNLLHWLEEQAPGRFHVMSDFAARWPSIKTIGVQVNSDFAATNREVVIEYIRARLTANRDLASDAGLLAAEAERHLGPSPRWARVARAYVEVHAWAPDGGLTQADVVRTLAFFSTGALTGLSAESVADLTFLEEALGSL
jgi:ABC-type nitrate/sulfonate/bicarbonate transport system substrate-binding protein